MAYRFRSMRMTLFVLAVLAALTAAPALAEKPRPAVCTNHAETTLDVPDERTGSGVALLQGGDFPVYEIYGDITEETYASLTKLIGDRKGGWLFLRSPGGKTYWSMVIGNMIRRQQICTYVPRGWICASGCAIVWAGGEQRWIAKGWKVGFHRASILKDGKTIYKSKDVDFWNQQLVSYYQGLGYSDEAIAKFQAPARTIYWLTRRDAERLNLGAKFWVQR
jgi:hypothetical protein